MTYFLIILFVGAIPLYQADRRSDLVALSANFDGHLERSFSEHPTDEDSISKHPTDEEYEQYSSLFESMGLPKYSAIKMHESFSQQSTSEDESSQGSFFQQSTSEDESSQDSFFQQSTSEDESSQDSFFQSEDESSQESFYKRNISEDESSQGNLAPLLKLLEFNDDENSYWNLMATHFAGKMLEELGYIPKETEKTYSSKQSSSTVELKTEVIRDGNSSRTSHLHMSEIEVERVENSSRASHSLLNESWIASLEEEGSGASIAILRALRQRGLIKPAPKGKKEYFSIWSDPFTDIRNGMYAILQDLKDGAKAIRDLYLKYIFWELQWAIAPPTSAIPQIAWKCQPLCRCAKLLFKVGCMVLKPILRIVAFIVKCLLRIVAEILRQMARPFFAAGGAMVDWVKRKRQLKDNAAEVPVAANSGEMAQGMSDEPSAPQAAKFEPSQFEDVKVKKRVVEAGMECTAQANAPGRISILDVNDDGTYNFAEIVEQTEKAARHEENDPVIYQKIDLLNPQCKENPCKTLDGDACVFPFKYDGQVFNKCSRTKHPRHWCATKRLSGGRLDMEPEYHGECNPEHCKDFMDDQCNTLEGKACKLPFKYQSVIFNGCTTMHTVKNYRYWCATEIDEKNELPLKWHSQSPEDGKWGYCEKNCKRGLDHYRCWGYPEGIIENAVFGIYSLTWKTMPNGSNTTAAGGEAFKDFNYPTAETACKKCESDDWCLGYVEMVVKNDPKPISFWRVLSQGPGFEVANPAHTYQKGGTIEEGTAPALSVFSVVSARKKADYCQLCARIKGLFQIDWDTFVFFPLSLAMVLKLWVTTRPAPGWGFLSAQFRCFKNCLPRLARQFVSAIKQLLKGLIDMFKKGWKEWKTRKVPVPNDMPANLTAGSLLEVPASSSTPQRLKPMLFEEVVRLMNRYDPWVQKYGPAHSWTTEAVMIGVRCRVLRLPKSLRRMESLLDDPVAFASHPVTYKEFDDWMDKNPALFTDDFVPFGQH